MSMSDGTSGTTAHARLPASDGISRRIARLQHEDAESRAAATMLRSVVEISGHGARYTFFISKMIWGVSLFMECGDWNENWKTFPRVSRAAGIIRTRARGNGWKHAEVIAATECRASTRMRSRGLGITISRSTTPARSPTAIA